MLRGDLDRLIEVGAVDQHEPADLLLGLGERPVGQQQLVLPDPNGRRVGRWCQASAADDHATLFHLL